MNTQIDRFLVDDHIQRLRDEAEAAHLASLGRVARRQEPVVPASRRRPRLSLMRRLVARLAAAG